MATQESANIVWVQAQAIRQLSDAGYERSSVVEAVSSSDLTKLKPQAR
jgi:hypothetical protein